MGNIKSLLVEFIMAFLLGIVGRIATAYILIYICCTFPSTEYLFLGRLGHFAVDIVPIFTGIPLGSSLGIFITKKYIFRSGTFNVLCLFTSLVFGFLAARFLCMAIPDYMCDLMSLGSTIVFPLVSLFAVIGYNAMAVLLKRRKESPK